MDLRSLGHDAYRSLCMALAAQGANLYSVVSERPRSASGEGPVRLCMRPWLAPGGLRDGSIHRPDLLTAAHCPARAPGDGAAPDRCKVVPGCAGG